MTTTPAASEPPAPTLAYASCLAVTEGIARRLPDNATIRRGEWSATWVADGATWELSYFEERGRLVLVLRGRDLDLRWHNPSCRQVGLAENILADMGALTPRRV